MKLNKRKEKYVSQSNQEEAYCAHVPMLVKTCDGVGGGRTSQTGLICGWPERKEGERAG